MTLVTLSPKTVDPHLWTQIKSQAVLAEPICLFSKLLLLNAVYYASLLQQVCYHLLVITLLLSVLVLFVLRLLYR